MLNILFILVNCHIIPHMLLILEDIRHEIREVSQASSTQWTANTQYSHIIQFISCCTATLKKLVHNYCA